MLLRGQLVYTGRPWILRNIKQETHTNVDEQHHCHTATEESKQTAIVTPQGVLIHGNHFNVGVRLQIPLRQVQDAGPDQQRRRHDGPQ
jgi:hypothetical protein